MSSLSYGRYYVLIQSPDKKTKLLRGYSNPTIETILEAAAAVGIEGKFLLSAEDGTVIGDDHALCHLLENGHGIVVAETLEDQREQIICKAIAETSLDIGTIDSTTELCAKMKELQAQFIFIASSLNNIWVQFKETQGNDASKNSEDVEANN